MGRRLKRDLPTERLASGGVGTVVLVHEQGAGYRLHGVGSALIAGSTSAIRRAAASIRSSGVISPRLRRATVSVAVRRQSSSALSALR